MDGHAQLKDSTLQTKLNELKGDAEQHLLDIYKQLENYAKEYEANGIDGADYYKNRAAFFKPYIAHLLTE